MLIYIIIAIIIAKIKKHKISVLKKAYWLFPFFIAEIIYITFQILVFNGIYWPLQYAEILKTGYLYLLIIPIIAYKLYKPALVGSASLLTGTILNQIVINANGGKMPVYATFSKLTGYFNEQAITNFDSLHCVGNSDTNLKILTDYIDIGYCILSIGDLFIKAFVVIIFYYSIKYLNKQKQL